MLEPCPCGKTPAYLCLTPGESCKWAWVSGDCCTEWNVEFKTHYKDIDSNECKKLALEAWNRSPREGCAETVLSGNLFSPLMWNRSPRKRCTENAMKPIREVYEKYKPKDFDERSLNDFLHATMCKELWLAVKRTIEGK